MFGYLKNNFNKFGMDDSQVNIDMDESKAEINPKPKKGKTPDMNKSQMKLNNDLKEMNKKLYERVKVLKEKKKKIDNSIYMQRRMIVNMDLSLVNFMESKKRFIQLQKDIDPATKRLELIKNALKKKEEEAKKTKRTERTKQSKVSTSQDVKMSGIVFSSDDESHIHLSKHKSKLAKQAMASSSEDEDEVKKKAELVQIPSSDAFPVKYFLPYPRSDFKHKTLQISIEVLDLPENTYRYDEIKVNIVCNDYNWTTPIMDSVINPERDFPYFGQDDTFEIKIMDRNERMTKVMKASQIPQHP